MRYVIMLCCSFMIIRNGFAVRSSPKIPENKNSPGIQLQVNVRPIMAPAIRLY
ncbi:hypothetical protein [Niastella populi]|uniref:hypothetical protein n=1 Tax=Niastella populi TaxID=550983 RepID=UPI0013FE0698|nr:hypothetical protein [Niastella populi]